MSTDILQTLGERMQVFRKSLRLSQRALARQIGISNNYLSEIENGQANPGFKFFWTLFDRFPLNPDWVFRGKGEMCCSIQEKVSDETIIRGIIESGEVNSLGELIILMELSNGYGHHILGYASQCLSQSRTMLYDALALREKKAQAKKLPL